MTAALAATTAQRNREYASPIVMAETVLARWPTDFARTMVGVQLAAAGRHDEAMRHLREAAPTFPRARYHLGGELFNAGQYEAAIDQLQEFVRERPYLLEAVRARTILGRAYLSTRKPSAAVEQFRLAMSMATPSTDAYVTATGFLADALFAQDKFADSIPYYRAFLAPRPNDGGALTNYGIALAATGKADDAVAAFRRAVHVNAADVTARRNLAKALFNQGHLEDAEKEAIELLRVKPADPVGHDLLGRALASKGRLNDARTEFERAVQIDPSDEQARADLELVLRTMRDGIRD